jgi:hypothetical protein
MDQAIRQVRTIGVLDRRPAVVLAAGEQLAPLLDDPASLNPLDIQEDARLGHIVEVMSDEADETQVDQGTGAGTVAILCVEDERAIFEVDREGVDEMVMYIRHIGQAIVPKVARAPVRLIIHRKSPAADQV